MHACSKADICGDLAQAYKTWSKAQGGSARQGGAVTKAVWREEQFLFGEWHVKEIGIFYRRVDKSGHCIVLQEGDPNKQFDPPSNMDYQQESDGKNVWHDVKGDWQLAAEGNGNKVIGAFAIV